MREGERVREEMITSKGLRTGLEPGPLLEGYGAFALPSELTGTPHNNLKKI